MHLNKNNIGEKKGVPVPVLILFCIVLGIFLLYFLENLTTNHQLFLIGGIAFLILIFMLSNSSIKMTNIFFILSFVPMFSWPTLELMDSFSTADPIQQFKIGIRALVFIYFLLLVLKKPALLKPLFHGTLKWFTIFTAYAFISVLYSPLKFFSGYCAVELLSYLIMTSVLVSHIKNEEDFKNLLNIIYISLAMIMVSGWLLSFIFPDIGWSKTNGIYIRLGGGFISTGGIALSACIIFLALLSRMIQSKALRKRKILYIIAGFLLITVILTIVRQIFIAIIIGILTIFYLLRRKIERKSYFLAIVATILICILLLVFHDNIVSLIIRGESTETLLTLNQRTVQWKLMLSQVYPKSPIWGQGYFIGASTHYLKSPYIDLGPFGGHNMFLNLLVTLGVIGLILILIPFILTFTDTAKLLKIKNKMNTINKNNINVYVEVFSFMVIFALLSLVHESVAARIGKVPIPAVFWIIAGATSRLMRLNKKPLPDNENPNHP
jgi:hypothetical protein